MKRKLIFGFFVVSSFFFGCGVESIEQEPDYSPPLDVSARNVFTNGTTKILISLWALNREEYFSGYRVYITTSSNDIAIDNNNDLSDPNKPLKCGYVLYSDLNESKPTVYMPTFGTAVFTNFMIDKYTNNEKLVDNYTYYLALRGYSDVNKKAGKKQSNIAILKYQVLIN